MALGVGAAATATMPGTALAGTLSGTGSPWRAATWQGLVGMPAQLQGAHGARRLTVLAPTTFAQPSGQTGEAFTVGFAGAAGLPGGTYRVTTPTTGPVELYLSPGTDGAIFATINRTQAAKR